MRQLAGTEWDAQSGALGTTTPAQVHSTIEHCTPAWCFSLHTLVID